MTTEEWINLPKTIEKSKKQYAHFDHRTDISLCYDYIKYPDNIRKHSFYPFIHYKKDMTKYSSISGKKPKERNIYYAAHIDSCIFQYYSYLINELYNKRIDKDGLYEVPIAYRSDLHKTNIFFSKKAFDFIKKTHTSYIMIGDYTGFFDHLDHQYLKEQWCSLLDVNHLPADHYAIFKNITRYSYWELEDLLQLNGLKDNKQGRKQINKSDLVLSHEDFHRYRSHIRKNKESYGIPQGSPISALLANVYMLSVDRFINETVTTYDGLYMRYSDDFIIVLPAVHEETAKKILLSTVNSINEVPGLILQNEKTQFFMYDKGYLENCGKLFYPDADENKRVLNYLGFSFDGKKVCLRAKTISKYYYKMYRKAKTISKNGGYTSHGIKISGKNLYERYSIKGVQSAVKGMNNKEIKYRYRNGNFLSYLQRARKEYGKDDFVDLITKRHMQKIKKALRHCDNTNVRSE